LFEKDINAVTHPMAAPRMRDSEKKLKKFPTALRKALNSNAPDPECLE
jgi:hypothetical protein